MSSNDAADTPRSRRRHGDALPQERLDQIDVFVALATGRTPVLPTPRTSAASEAGPDPVPESTAPAAPPVPGAGTPRRAPVAGKRRAGVPPRR